MVKHGFSKKRAADRHAVEPARELAIAPRFHRMRIAGSMKCEVAFDDLLVDPRLGALAAGTDHLVENRVDAQFK